MKLEHDIIVLLLCIIGLLVVILITGCNEEERVLVQVLDGCEVVDSYYTNAPAGSTGTVTVIKEER